MPSRNIRYVILIAAFTLLACNFGSLLGNATSTPVVPTSAPAPTATDQAPEGEQEAIFIFAPGSSSMLTSPITITGEADPTFEQNLVVAIYGEDGTQLAISPTTIQADVGQRGPFTVDLSFSVATQQAGRISVFDLSAMDGGIVHLSSVDVMLMPSGTPQITSQVLGLESIALLVPQQSAQISGGIIPIKGFSDYYFESNLGYVLCGGGLESGPPDDLCGSADNVLAAGAIMINSPDMGQPGPIDAQITYSVSEPTTVRLVIYATSPRDGGLIHVTSRVLQLNP